MKRLLLFVIISLAIGAAQAQQQIMYTMYMFNTQSFNPAYVGTQDKISAILLAREQWVGFDGAPSTQTFSLNVPVARQRIGIGLNILNDVVGPVQEIMGAVDFSYIIHLGENTKLSLGIKGELDVYQLNLTELEIHDQRDPSFQENRRGDLMPNFGAGAYLYGKKYYIGFSVPRMLKNTISVENNAIETSALGKQDMHMFLTGGYVFEFSSGLVFRPSVLIKYVYGAPVSFDLAGNFLISQRLWLGGSYRVGDALSGIVQYGITPNLWVGYSYGYSLSEISNFNSGTHEIMLMYDFNFSKRKFRSPRYF